MGKNRRGNELDEFAQAQHTYQSILLEYGYLASLPRLSEEQADYLDGILEKAESDELLNFLLIEFDYIIAKNLNLLDAQHSSHYKDQQAYLREYLLTLAEELDCHCELQKLLRNKGFYRGVINGVFGEDLREAVKQFQQSAHLQVNGVLTPETVLKLVSTVDDVLVLFRDQSIR